MEVRNDFNDWYVESYDGMFFLIIMLFNVFCKGIFLYYSI